MKKKAGMWEKGIYVYVPRTAVRSYTVYHRPVIIALIWRVVRAKEKLFEQMKNLRSNHNQIQNWQCLSIVMSGTTSVTLSLMNQFANEKEVMM